jgi:hypothetical protein
MPELPDIVVYLEALEQRILNQTLERLQIYSPFLLRTAAPPITSVEGKRVIEFRRVGKRICIGLEEDLWLVLHLMIAGRLHWKEGGKVTTAHDGGDKPEPRSLALPHFISQAVRSRSRRPALNVVPRFIWSMVKVNCNVLIPAAWRFSKPICQALASGCNQQITL